MMGDNPTITDIVLLATTFLVLVVAILGDLMWNWWHGLALIPFVVVAVVLMSCSKFCREMLTGQ